MIHVVQEGETLESISNYYKIPMATIIRENGITNPSNLVVGQTLVILYPLITYVVVEGDTLVSIANQYGISVMQILRNNPDIADREALIPGDTIVISYDTNKKGSIEISGYAYPFIDRNTLRKTLPFLTYLNIFNYRYVEGGQIVDIEDEEIVKIARMYGVAPMLTLSSLTERGVGNEKLILNMLTDGNRQNLLIEDAVQTLKRKGYYGINIYTQYLNPDTRGLYEIYIKRMADRMHAEGFRIIITINPEIKVEGSQIIYVQTDYSRIAQYVDAIVYLSYSWGNTYSPPGAITPINLLREVANYLTESIPSEEIFIGLPIIGYDWQLPYLPGESRASAVTTKAAIDIAAFNKVAISYSEISAAPYFFYLSQQQDIHIVWFKDARSIEAFSNLITEYSLEGITIWNIMNFFTQMWYLLNSEFEVIKVLEIE